MALLETHSDRSALQKSIAIGFILVAMVSIPYFFPVPLSISRSYVAGFSNRTAILIMLFGTGLFAVFVRGRIAPQAVKDSRLSWHSLLFALILTLARCLRLCAFPVKLPGSEADYFINRLQLLAAGLHPYQQFEFVYGPFLLYPILWVQKLLHVSSTQAYAVTWTIFWLVGVFMIWVVVREIDFPIPSRVSVFGLLVITQLIWSAYGGLSYTSFRAYFAAFCITVTYRVWTRFRRPWLVCLCAVLCIALAICCSMDQAVGVAIGLFAFMIHLALTQKREFSWQPFALWMLASAVCFALADRGGLTLPLRSFGGGGYAYPLLPSIPIFITLFIYIVAGCALYRGLFAAWLRKGEEGIGDPPLSGSVLVPLALAGYSMIPNALGRCDILHITAAIPAFVVGVAVICAMPTVWRWWFPTAILGLVLLPVLKSYIFQRLEPPSSPTPIPGGYIANMNDNQWYVSPSDLSASELPCDRQYFSPSFMPVPTEKFLPACLDTGYFLGFTDVITPKTIEYKINELKEHASEPLLMENSPLEAQLPRQLATMKTLYIECESFWVPPVRHEPLTYAPIIEYIRKHYVEGPPIADGRLRIWYPIAAQPAGS